MNKEPYLPLRTCAGCRKKGDKKQFLRIAKTGNGEVFFDPDQKAGGRGVYLCRNKTCLDIARKKRALERGLRTPISEEVYAKLSEELL